MTSIRIVDTRRFEYRALRDDLNGWSYHRIWSRNKKISIVLYHSEPGSQACYLHTGGSNKMHSFISIMLNSSPNPMLYHLLESSRRDDSNKWSNIGFVDEITQVESIEVYFTHLI